MYIEIPAGRLKRALRAVAWSSHFPQLQRKRPLFLHAAIGGVQTAIEIPAHVVRKGRCWVDFAPLYFEMGKAPTNQILSIEYISTLKKLVIRHGVSFQVHPGCHSRSSDLFSAKKTKNKNTGNIIPFPK